MIGESRGEKIFKVFNYTFLTLFGFITLYPFWYVLVASFNTGRDFAKGGVYFWPREWTVENYTKAFTDERIYTALGISVARTLIGTLAGLIGTSLVAYALCVKTFVGRGIITFYWYFTTMFGGGMIPYYILLRTLGLTSSFWLYVIPGIFGFFNFILIRTNFATIPEEIRESAELDGAGDLRILFQFYIPLSMPIMATVALFIGVGHWNDWFTGAYYCSRTELYPAATLLQRLLKEASAGTVQQQGQEYGGLIEQQMRNTTPQSLQMSFVMILTMPIVIVYPFLQKYYVKGVMVGSVKG